MNTGKEVQDYLHSKSENHSGGFLTASKDLVRTLGLHETIIYEELLSRYDYFSKRKKLQDGWFFNTVADLKDATTLSRHQQIKAIEKLRSLNLLDSKSCGFPSKRYFKIVRGNKCKEILLQLVKNLPSSTLKSDHPVGKKVTSNKTNINKTNNKNNINGSLHSVSENHNDDINMKIVNQIIIDMEKEGHSVLENCSQIILYYLTTYSDWMVNSHPIIKRKYWHDVIKKISDGPENEYDDSLDVSNWNDLINKHFITDYKKCDYSIIHFATNNIMKNRYYDSNQ